jgi:beta-glucanase (GH16 family)
VRFPLPTLTFEIAVNKSHWPNVVNASLHQQAHSPDQIAWRAPLDLARDFHSYACLWNEREIIYYWDGLEIARKPNTQAQRPGPVMARLPRHRAAFFRGGIGERFQ